MLTIDRTAFVLVDYQGRLAKVMHESEELHTNMMQLVKGMQILDVPIVWVEQYPKGLGPTVDEVRQLLAEDRDHEPIAKMHFSACGNDEIQTQITELGKDQFIVAGIEAHVCVYQTVQELLADGKHVEYVEDAISSRTNANKNIAMEKMNLLGAYPTSVEMVLFELMGTAEHPKFREISSLIK